ncbi:MAG: response regulator [Bacteroidia bacterium]|nr:response regulator [Bacteroidia bacterium]
MLVRQTLTDNGYNILDVLRFAEHVMDKLDSLEVKPDVIVSDIYLAGDMTGIDAAVLVKEKYDIPTIFVSAYSDSATKEKADAVGYKAYLTKPINEFELMEEIDKC